MIKGIGFDHKTFKFPVGEMHIKLHSYSPNSRVSLHFHFEKNEDIIELIMVCNALKHAGLKLEAIAMPYVPFGRQDRVAVEGECFSLEAFAEIINSLNVPVIEIADPHSYVTTALIKNCKVLHQYEIFERYLRDKSPYWIICPDGGAGKKINEIGKVSHVALKCLGIVECSKVREVKTGAILSTKVHATDLGGSDCYIIDDICDGGRTFIEIAKVLKTLNCGKIILMVTHGFFTNKPTPESTGLEVFDGLIDEIYTLNGKVK